MLFVKSVELLLRVRCFLLEMFLSLKKLSVLAPIVLLDSFLLDENILFGFINLLLTTFVGAFYLTFSCLRGE